MHRVLKGFCSLLLEESPDDVDFPDDVGVDVHSKVLHTLLPQAMPLNVMPAPAV